MKLTKEILFEMFKKDTPNYKKLKSEDVPYSYIKWLQNELIKKENKREETERLIKIGNLAEQRDCVEEDF